MCSIPLVPLLRSHCNEQARGRRATDGESRTNRSREPEACDDEADPEDDEEELELEEEVEEED